MTAHRSPPGPVGPNSSGDAGDLTGASDNQRPDPMRLFGVVEGAERSSGDAWEREVRKSLADQAGHVRHSRLDLAGTAIARASRVRRRRSVVGMAAVLLGTLLATGVLLQDWGGDGGGGTEYGAITGQRDGVTESPTPEPEVGLATDQAVPIELSADVIGGGADGGLVLATSDGQQLDLGSVRQVDSAQQVGDGWAVVGGDPGTTRLWWVTGGREPVPVLTGMDAIVVQHGQVAWQRGALLSAGRLSANGELEAEVRTRAPQGDGEPVGFLDDAVLLSRTGSTGWDTWHPARGEYRPTWTDQVIRVYGPLPDGPAALGLVAESGDGGACLARLDEELVAKQVSCVSETLPPVGPAAVSPQGRWLLTSAPGDSLLVDLVDAFDPQKKQAAITGLEGPAGMAATPVWLGPDRVVFATANSLVQLWPDRLRAHAADAVQEIPLLGVAPVLVQPV